MLYMSQMTRNITRLTDTLFVTDNQDMTSLFETLSVTPDHGYDNANRYFIWYK